MNSRSRALLLLACTALASCGAHKPGDELSGRAFELESSQGAELLAGAGVSLRFHSDGLSLQADCNTMSGTYKISDGRLVVGDLMETAMGCDPERHARDAFLSKLLASKPKLQVKGTRLTLQGQSARLVFLDREVANPDRPLVGTVWVIGIFVEGQTAMGLMGIELPKLTFAADGTWQASATCLSARGAYVVEGDRIALSNARATVASDCKDSNDREAASFVASVMKDGSLGVRIESQSLTLEGGARSLGATGIPR